MKILYIALAFLLPSLMATKRSDFAQMVLLSKPSKKDTTDTSKQHLTRLLAMMIAYHEMKSSFTATGLKSCSGKKNGE